MAVTANESLIYRGDRPEGVENNLTPAEVDGNFKFLDEKELFAKARPYVQGIVVTEGEFLTEFGDVIVVTEYFDTNFPTLLEAANNDYNLNPYSPNHNYIGRAFPYIHRSTINLGVKPYDTGQYRQIILDGKHWSNPDAPFEIDFPEPLSKVSYLEQKLLITQTTADQNGVNWIELSRWFNGTSIPPLPAYPGYPITTEYTFLKAPNGKLNLISAGTVSGGTGGTVEGEATYNEDFTTALKFTNPLGHYRQSHTQTGAVTFTLASSDNKAGSTIIQPFVSDGISPLNFDFAYRSDLNSGDIPAAGNYDIYFNYEPNRVRVHLDKIGEVVAPGPITPAAPTNFVTNDADNTGDWTNNPDYTSIADYEYTINGGAAVFPVTAKPQPVGNVNIPIGQVGIRVKGATNRNPSAWLFNTEAFTGTGSGTTPVVVLSDNFNRSENPLLSPPVGANWVHLVGNMIANGAHAVGTTAGNTVVSDIGVTDNYDYEIKLGNIEAEHDALYVMCGINSTNSGGRGFGFHGRVLTVYYNDADGVFRTQGGLPYLMDGDVILLTVRGNVVRVYRNQVQVIVLNIDERNVNETYVGFYTGNNTESIDSVTVTKYV